MVSVTPSPSAPLYCAFDPMPPTAGCAANPSDEDTSLEGLLYEMFHEISNESNRATASIWTPAIRAENLWRAELLKRIGTENEVAHTWEQRSENIHAVTDVATPLTGAARALVVSLSQGFSTTTIGIIALGAVLALDKLCGDPAKKLVATLLARQNAEAYQTWFRRIVVCTSLVGLAVQFDRLGFKSALPVASEVSALALNGTSLVVDRKANTQQARLLGLNSAWEESGRRLQDMLGEFDQHVQMMHQFFEMLAAVGRSYMQTVDAIVS